MSQISYFTSFKNIIAWKILKLLTLFDSILLLLLLFELFNLSSLLLCKRTLNVTKRRGEYIANLNLKAQVTFPKNYLTKKIYNNNHDQSRDIDKEQISEKASTPIMT